MMPGRTLAAIVLQQVLDPVAALRRQALQYVVQVGPGVVAVQTR